MSKSEGESPSAASDRMLWVIKNPQKHEQVAEHMHNASFNAKAWMIHFEHGNSMHGHKSPHATAGMWHEVVPIHQQHW